MTSQNKSSLPVIYAGLKIADNDVITTDLMLSTSFLLRHRKIIQNTGHKINKVQIFPNDHSQPYRFSKNKFLRNHYQSRKRINHEPDRYENSLPQ